MLGKEQIAAALKKLGPSNCNEVAAELGADPSAVLYHLKGMLAAGALKASPNRHKRVYALPEQKIDGAPTPPQGKRTSKKKKGNGAGNKKNKPAPRAPRATDLPEFIPAIDADMRLVCVNGTHPPVVFSIEHTERIATLLLQHFKA